MGEEDEVERYRRGRWNSVRWNGMGIKIEGGEETRADWRGEEGEGGTK